MEQEERLAETLGCVDSFGELYFKTVLKWMAKEKCDVSMVKFVLGEKPYFFPPEIIYTKNGKEEKILNYQLPYKRGENHNTGSDASDINSFLMKEPEYFDLIMERYEEHLKKFRENQGIPVLHQEQENENKKLVVQGIYKEMDYYRTSLSIYDYIRETGNCDEEEKICGYLKEGKMLMQSQVEIKDVINSKNGVIGHFCLLTDGIWMWPAELSYYVENYHLELDREFIETMRKRNWHVTKPLVIDYTRLELADFDKLGIDSLI